MDQVEFDAIVIGSGVSGGWAAKELTEKGLKVLLLERGRHVTHGDDYVGEHKPPWEFKFHGMGDRKLWEAEYYVQKRARAFEEGSTQFFVNDKDNPYQTDPDRPFSWIRGYQTGGKSLTWGRATPRYSALNFMEAKQDGTGMEWPIRYEDIAPWYSHVERFIGVSGRRDGIDAVPDGEFLPPFAMNCVEDHVSAAIAKNFPGRAMIAERCAVLSQDHNGRAKCHFCGPCYRGCSTGSYFSSLSSTLPAAQATGNLTIQNDAIVDGIDYDPKTRRASGVRVIDAATGARRVVRSRIVFLNAATVATTQILLNSRSDSFPTGLANSSGVLGHYLMDQVMGPMVEAEFSGFLDHQPIGNRPNGIYIPRFRNIGRRDVDFIRGYGYQGRAFRSTWMRGSEMTESGVALKQALRSPGPWYMFIGGMGESLPYYDNQIALAPTKTDKWGIPQVRVSFGWGENERNMAKDMADQAEAMLAAAGGKILMKTADLAPGGLAIHEMGTARMGHDPKQSVLNGHNQAHDVANLFVSDGACMTGCAAQNPSLTYMALTARAADFAVTQMKSGAI